MKLMKTTRYIFLAMMAIVCMTFTACGGDDDSTPAGGGDNGGGGNTYDNMMVINGTKYGPMLKCYILQHGDGTASLTFANVDLYSGTTTATTKITQLAVKFQYQAGLVGQYPQIDVDFDVNRVPATQARDLTGYSLKGTMNISPDGDNYKVDVNVQDLHIFQSDSETGNGQAGKLELHYQGKIENGYGVGTVN